MSKTLGLFGKGIAALVVLFFVVMIAAGLLGDDPVYEQPPTSRIAQLAELEQGTEQLRGLVRVTGGVRRPDLMIQSAEFVFLPYTSTPNSPESSVSFVVWFRASDMAKYEQSSARKALSEPTGTIELREDGNTLLSGVTARQVMWRKPVYVMRLN